jgi:hypothetical protein
MAMPDQVMEPPNAGPYLADPTKLLFDAYLAARNALTDPNCAGLFNTDANRPHTYSAGLVLGAMVMDIPINGVRFGKVIGGQIDIDAVAVTQPAPGAVSTGSGYPRAATANIVLQTNPAGLLYTKLSYHDLALTLIHELGHVFNIVTSLGGSAIKYDANSSGKPDASAQKENDRLLSKCRPRLN